MNHLTQYTQDIQVLMQTWRRDIHRHPELGFEEHRTSEQVAELLTSFGIEVHKNFGRTGVVGVLKAGTSQRGIGLRADMDALSILEKNTFDHRSLNKGKMHACGHDGHTAMLLGAAHFLSKQQNFDGTIIFIFQPAEEHGEGAKSMISDGLFERFPIDTVYAIHNFPSLETGKFSVREGSVMAAEDNFEIAVRGLGSHAAMPHLGRDAIVTAAEIIMALQSVVSRTINPMDNAVISITEISSNGIVNVLPGEVIIKGDTRSMTHEVQQQIEDSMQRIVSGICAANGVDYSFDYRRNFIPTINTGKEAEIASQIAAKIVGSDNVIGNSQAAMISEDFGYMLQARPGAYVLLGNGKNGVGGCSLHNAEYDFNDDILCMGADFWVQLVNGQLSRSGL